MRLQRSLWLQLQLAKNTLQNCGITEAGRTQQSSYHRKLNKRAYKSASPEDVLWLLIQQRHVVLG